MKTTRPNDEVLRYTLGELPPEDADRVAARIAEEPALRAETARLEAIAGGLRASRADSFAPYFSDRVMRRLRGAAESSESLYASLQWIFARASVAAVGAAVLIGAYNIAQFGDLSVADNLLDVVFGLPSADFVDALLAGPL